MLTFDETISTLQSSYQTIYGLIVGFMAVLSDLKEGKQVITASETLTTPLPPPTTSDHQQQQLTSSSSSSQLDDNVETDYEVNQCLIDTDHEKGRALIIIKNVLALWHFVVNLLYLIKRAVAVKVHIEDPKKIVINPMRVKKLTYKFHNYFMK